MTGYWKNQRQYEGAVKVSAASMGGPGAGKVPGLPDVSGGSDQDRQDESEGKGCGVVPASASAKASGSLGPLGSIPGQSFLSESSDPLCCCEERVCRCTDEQRAYLEGAIYDGQRCVYSLDGRERTYSGVYGVEKYERKCLHCGEWFELLAQPDEDRRLHCSKGCYRWADL